MMPSTSIAASCHRRAAAFVPIPRERVRLKAALCGEYGLRPRSESSSPKGSIHGTAGS